MLLSALQPTESEALRMQAVKAVGAFILLHDKEPAIQKHFSDLLLPFMQVGIETMSFNSNGLYKVYTAHELRDRFSMKRALP